MNQRETANSSTRIFLHILFKRKLQIISFFCITLIIVGAYTTVTDTVYEASAEILVKVGRENLYTPTNPDAPSTPLLAFSSQEQINSEIELIKSRPLIEKVIDTIGPGVIYTDLGSDESSAAQPGMIDRLLHKLRFDKLIGFISNKVRETTGKKNPNDNITDRDKVILRVQDSLGVIGIKNSRVIEITFKHHDAQMSALVVESLINAYLEVRPKIHKNPQSYHFFVEQSDHFKDKIRSAEAELKDFKEKHSLIALEEERSILLTKKADLDADLNRSLSAKVETEQRIHQITQQLNETPEKIQQGETTNLNPMLINTLEDRLVNLEVREKELLAKYTESNHMVQEIRKQLKLVRDKLAEQENKQYGSTSYGMNPTYQGLKQDLNDNETELVALKAKIVAQRSQITGYNNRLTELNSMEEGLTELTNKLDLFQENYRLYLTKLEETRISSEMESKNIANVSIIKPAQPPIKPQSPKVPLNIAIGFFVAVFGSIGMALFLEFFNDNLERPEDIEEYLNSPVLASIPKSKA